MKSGTWILKWRWTIIIGFLVLTMGLGTNIFKTTIDSDLRNHMPVTMLSRINTDKLEDLFGGSEMLLILLESDDVLEAPTLIRLRRLSKQLSRMRGVERSLSLFNGKNILSEKGSMIVSPAVESVPQTIEQREKLRESLQENDLVYKILVSEDFTLTAIIVTLAEGIQDETILGQIHQMIKEIPGEETIHIGGLPVIRKTIHDQVAFDFIVLMPVALILMLAVLFIAFRQLRGVLLPFGVVLLSIVFSMGLLPLFGWEIAIITILLPVMLIAIANNYGIHLIARYQELNTATNTMTKEGLAIQVHTGLVKPILLTGLTTIAGILGLLSHVIIPAKQLGILAALGIGYALLLSLFFIPAVLSFLPKGKPVFRMSRYRRRKLDSILWRLGSGVARYPRRIFVFSIIVFIGFTIGILFVEIDSNQENFFRKEHPVKISSNIINAHFGGSQNLSVLFSGDLKDPRILKRMDQYEKKLKGFPGIGNTVSIAQVVRKISQAMNDSGDTLYNTIPGTRNGVAQYLELYTLNGDPEDLEQLIDFEYENAQLVIRVNDGNTSTVKEIVHEVEGLVQEDSAAVLIGGSSLAVAELADLVIRGQFVSLFVALIVIMTLMMLLFRSWFAGLLSALPLILAMAMLFGLMGYIGIPLDIVSALLSSIMIGVGVDYTIHFLWRYREEREKGLSYSDAVIKTITTTGRGILFNAISVIIGFSALFISSFIPVQTFAFLVVVSISGCLIGSLVLVPVLCLLWKPRFLEPRRVNEPPPEAVDLIRTRRMKINQGGKSAACFTPQKRESYKTGYGE